MNRIDQALRARGQECRKERNGVNSRPPFTLSSEQPEMPPSGVYHGINEARVGI